MSKNRSPQFAMNEKDQYLIKVGLVLDSQVNHLNDKF
jgi:hypothetical protein